MRPLNASSQFLQVQRRRQCRKKLRPFDSSEGAKAKPAFIEAWQEMDIPIPNGNVAPPRHRFPFSAENMALDEVLLELKAEQRIPPPFDSSNFSPHGLVGHHQAWEKRCASITARPNEIDLNRRLTGGSSLLGHDELGWEITSPGEIRGSRRELKTSTEDRRDRPRGLQDLGLPASFRPGTTLRSTAERFQAPGALSFLGLSSSREPFWSTST